MGRTKKGTTAPKVKKAADPVPKEYTCVCCGKSFQHQRGNFPVTQSNWFNGNNHYVPFCKNCAQEMFKFYSDKYNSDQEAIKRILAFFDVWYSDELVSIAQKSSPTKPLLSHYFARINMKQYSGKTFDDYLDTLAANTIESAEDLEELKESDTGTKVSNRMLKTWGVGLEESDYLFLEEEYKDWTARHECKTKAQETCFKSIALAQLNLRKANLSGDTKKIKEAADTLQSLMASANVKPSQTNDNTLAETNTFGTLIRKWENTKPIPEPDPEWKDVDGMGRYFRVWVLGTVLKMFNIKNPYQDEYDAEIAAYTASRPQYEDNDTGSDAIRQRIFGGAEGGDRI